MWNVEKMREDKKEKKETKSEAKPEIKYSEIDKLTDDCLIQIFLRLTTIADKIRIERVCKRWQNVSQRSWHNFKSLDFLAKTWGIKANYSGALLIRSFNFEKIIRLSGRYLTSISIDVGKFAKICHLLPKIQDLQLVDDCLDQGIVCPDEHSYVFASNQNKQKTSLQCTFGIWQVILPWLLSHGKNITSFKLHTLHSHHKEKDFIKVLGKMKQLICFHLYYCEYLDWSGNFLLHLPFETIQEIFLMSTYDLNFRNIMPLMIKNCKNLQAFGMEGGNGHADRILEVLPSHSHTLKTFRLQFDEIRKPHVLLSTISALVHLEKLNFSSCFEITDTFLEVVGKKCKELTYLNINRCLRITDRGISGICDLKNLTYLNIGGLPEIENPPLEKLTNLVYLRSSCNKNLEEKCLCSVLEKAHQLRALDLQYCSFVTNKLASVAAEALLRRNSDIGLDLCVTGTSINLKTVYEKSPLLNFVEDSECMTTAKYGIEDDFLKISDEEVSIC